MNSLDNRSMNRIFFWLSFAIVAVIIALAWFLAGMPAPWNLWKTVIPAPMPERFVEPLPVTPLPLDESGGGGGKG